MPLPLAQGGNGIEQGGDGIPNNHSAGLYQLLILTLTGNAKASVGRMGFGLAPALFCVGGKKYSSLYSPFGAREYPL